jgi:hypothetical protein
MSTGTCLDSQDISPKLPAVGDSLTFQSRGGWTPTGTVVAQPVWYFDAVNGNDANDGLTATTALRTGAEYTRRTGPSPIFDQVVDFYVLRSMPELAITGRVTVNGFPRVHGVPSVLHAGSLSAVTVRNPSANQSDELEDGTLDWSPFVGVGFVEITTGDPNGPTRTWVAKGLGGPARARVSMLSQRNLSINQGYNSTPTVGLVHPSNPYRVLQPPTITDFTFSPTFDAAVVSYQAFAEFLNVPTAIVEFGVIYSECLGGRVTLRGGVWLDSCAASALVWMSESSTTQFGLALNAFLTGSGTLVAYGLMMQASNVHFEWDTGIQGGIFQSHHASWGTGVYDCSTPFHVGETGNLTLPAGIYGTGNSGTTFEIEGSGRVYAPNATLYATTSGQDFTLNGLTSGPAVQRANPYGYTADIPYTFANFFTPVGGGGFGGSAFDPRDPSTGMSAGQAIV